MSTRDPILWRLPFAPVKEPVGTEFLLALGSSMGDRYRNLQLGLLHLLHDPQVVLGCCSSVWETQPIGAANNRFYNCCVRGTTTKTPHELLTLLLDIERRCERLRGVHWMDRTLDLDLLLYGEQQLDTPSLSVPHPRMLERDFVMVPAIEIASEWIHPETHKPLAENVSSEPLGMWKVGRFVIANRPSMQ